MSTITRAREDFDIARPGKDSYLHRQAGAVEVMVASRRRWALMHELGEAQEPSLEELIAHMVPADLLLVEGFKRTRIPNWKSTEPLSGDRCCGKPIPMFLPSRAIIS